MKKCIVLVSDKNYISKTFETIYFIRSIGNYNGDIVLLPHPELKESKEILELENRFNIKCKFFDLIDTSFVLEKYLQRPFNSSNFGMVNKYFQFHKFYLFDNYFKSWDFILYIDVGMKIYKDINIFWDIVKENTLLAHSDNYPYYNRDLSSNFNKDSYPEIFNLLKQDINLSKDSFQSTLMLYDTKIIQDDTVSNLIKLMNKYYISNNNDQAILNIYFKDVWFPLRIYHKGTFLYDFSERYNFKTNDYVMLKYPSK
jgi:hypothetical protein